MDGPRMVSIDGVAGVWLPEVTAGGLLGHLAGRRREMLQRYGTELQVEGDVRAFAELVATLAAFRERSADGTIGMAARAAETPSVRDLLDAEQVAGRLGCSAHNVRARARRGSLPAVRQDPWLFDPAVIDEHAQSRAS